MDQSNDSGKKRKREEEFKEAWIYVNYLLRISKLRRICNGGGCNGAHNAMLVSPPLINLLDFPIPMRFFRNDAAPRVPLQLENGPGPNALQVQEGVIPVCQNGNRAIDRGEIPVAAAGMPVEAVLPGQDNNAHQPNVAGIPVAAVAAFFQEQDNNARQVPNVAGIPVAAVFPDQDNNARQVPNVRAVVEVPIIEDGFAGVLSTVMVAGMNALRPVLIRQANFNVNAANTSSLQTQNIARMQRRELPGYNLGEIAQYVGMSGVTGALSAISGGSAALGNLMSNNGAVAGPPVGENSSVREFTGAFSSFVGTGMARVVSQVASHIAASITQPNLPGNPQQAPDNGQ